MTRHFDILIIGSGGGLKIALPAAHKGLKTALIEEGPCGGTCLNRGCIPSKMLIYPADLLGLIERGPRVDITLPEPPLTDFPALVGRINRTIGDMSANIGHHLLNTPNLTVFRDHAEFVDNKTVQAGTARLTADRIFIAVGSRPQIPAIEGLAGTPFMTSTDALTRRTLPRRMAILGAGYIACELGHAYRAFGCETHFIVRSRFLRHEDRDVARLFEEEFSRRHAIHRGKIQRISYQNGLFTIELEDDNATREHFQAEDLLVAAGVVPNTDRLKLERTGIRLDARGMIPVDDHLRTAVEGVYALGDCIGRYLFRHSVNLEGEYLVRSLLDAPSPPAPIDYGPMPHAVFTDPEIAGAGATEQELREKKIDYIAGRADYAESNMGLARQNQTGFVKILAERATGRLLGAHIIGEDASTLVQTLVAMMYHHATIDDLLRVVYIHPALPELLRDAARDAAAKR